MTRHEDRLRTLVDEMLTDAGHGGDAGLRHALESIGSLASLPVPEPSGELAALLACPDDELAGRRRAGRHRPTVVGLAVIAGMGLGIGGVAATSSGGAPGSSAASVQQLLEDWSPGGIFTQGALPAHFPGYAGAAETAPQSVAADPAAVPEKGTGGGHGLGLGHDRTGLPGPEGKQGCGNSQARPAAARAGICPPAAAPSGESGQPQGAGKEGQPAGTPASGDATEAGVDSDGASGRAGSGQDTSRTGNGTGPATPRRGAGNGEAPGPTGANQPGGSGQAKPGAGGK